MSLDLDLLIDLAATLGLCIWSFAFVYFALGWKDGQGPITQALLEDLKKADLKPNNVRKPLQIIVRALARLNPWIPNKP